MKRIILITGYARAGKDTFAEGILLAASKPTWKTNFADPLKEAADSYMQSLHIGGHGATNTFRNEVFKVKHRHFLVSAGEFARSLDVDVFAKALCRRCELIAEQSKEEDLNIVCSDWRYLNEYDVVVSKLANSGWCLHSVHVSTEGVIAANEAEGVSIGKLVRLIPMTYCPTFHPNSRQDVLNAGKRFAREVGM